MTVQTDFYVPDFEIIINGQSFRYGRNVDVMSVSITETINQADSFSITVREHNPKPGRFASGDLAWLDNNLFDEGNQIEIELGYQNNRAVKLKGHIMGMNVNFPESGAPTLTVRGYSLYHQLHRKKRRKPFDAKTDSGIAREIAGALGLRPDVKEVDMQHPLVSPIGTSYAAILEERAKRLNFEVKVKDDTLIFKRPTYLVSASPALTLVWGESLRSFAPNVSIHNMPTKIEARNTQTGQGGSKKEALVGSATVEDVPSVLGSTSGLARAKDSFGDSVLLAGDQRLASPGEAKSLPKAEMERRALDYIVAHGSCIGNPQLVSRQVIELKGLGKRFSGKYYVTSTTHTIGTNGYLTEFEAKRDGR